MDKFATGSAIDGEIPGTSDIAIRLLEFQQRLDAWDRLYNEEIVGMRRELSQVKADFVSRLHEHRASLAPLARRRRRKGGKASEDV